MAKLWFVLASLVLLAACPPKPPPTPPVPPRVDASVLPVIPICVASSRPLAADVCDGRFTDELLACVRCHGAEGCFEEIDVIYCVKGGCSDPNCHTEREPPTQSKLHNDFPHSRSH